LKEQEQLEMQMQLQNGQTYQFQQHQYQPQQLQDQIFPQSQQPQRSQSLHELENPYLKQQPSVVDVEFKQQSSPIRSTSFGFDRGGVRLSSGSIGSGQAGIGIATAPTGGPAAALATPSWVLPKKPPPATVSGGSPISAHRDIGGGGFSGQFRGTNLSDPGFIGGLGRNHSSQGA